jgi:predicted dehydrogenase
MSIRLAIAGLRHPHVEGLIEEALRQDSPAQLVAIADDDSPTLARYAARLGVPAYSDYHEMLQKERLNAVGVAAINGRRGRIVVDCLDAGLHVVSDKPLCTSLMDLEDIRSAWNRGGRILSMMLDKRFYPPTLALKEMLEADDLGDPVLAWASGPHRLNRPARPDWMFRRDLYGGILNDLAIHDVDLLIWLTGIRSGKAQGLTGNLGNDDAPEFEDYGQLLLRADGGMIASCEVHWFSPEAAPYHGKYRMVLTGTEGTAELDWARNELTVATHRIPPRSVPLPPAQNVTRDFFNAITNGTEPVVRTREVLAATRVTLLAQTTANTGAWQDWAVE